MNDADNNVNNSSQTGAQGDSAAAAATTESPQAPGSGQVLTTQPQATLQARLDDTAARMAGTEKLSPEVATMVTSLINGATTSSLTRTLMQATLDFINKYGPGCNVADDDGARGHISYYRNVQNYINNAPEDFRTGFGALMRVISDQSGENRAFGARYLFRFVPTMRMSPPDRRGLELLFTALVVLSTPNGRAQAKRQVDLQKVAESALNSNGGQRLIGYFSI
jgi:hypothetical protein